MSLIRDSFGRTFESGVLHPVINGKLPPGMHWPDKTPVHVTAYVLTNNEAVQVDTLPDRNLVPANAAFWTALDPAAMFGEDAVPCLARDLAPTTGE